jgi:hypothetical protein
VGRPSTTRVLHRIVAREAREPLVLRVSHPLAWPRASLASPELGGARPVAPGNDGTVSIDLRGLRIYARVQGEES